LLGRENQKKVYGSSLQFRNRLKEKFEWDIEDDLSILLEDDPGSHPELAANFPEVEMEAGSFAPNTAVDPEASADANLAAAAAAANSGISHTPGVNHDDNAVQPVGPQNHPHQHPVTDDKDSDSESESENDNNQPLVKTIDPADEEDEEPRAVDPSQGRRS
jgi:hypothetical protein